MSNNNGNLNLIDNFFLILGLGSMAFGIFLSALYLFNRNITELSNISILFFCSLISLGLYSYRRIHTYSVVLLLLSYFLVFIGYFELLFRYYHLGMIPYLFQIGLVILGLMGKKDPRETDDLETILLSLDSLFIIGIISIYFYILLITLNQVMPAFSISIDILELLPSQILNAFGIQIDYNYKILEDIFSGISTIWFVSSKRKEYEQYYKSRGISKYSIIACVITGAILIFISIVYVLSKRITPIASILIICFGFAFIYPNLRWIQDKRNMSRVFR